MELIDKIRNCDETACDADKKSNDSLWHTLYPIFQAQENRFLIKEAYFDISFYIIIL